MEKLLKVVIIDDNKDYLFSMETFLSRNGFIAQTASNGKDGLDLIKKEHPDVILLDVMMESMLAGLEVCKAVRSDPQLEYIPIVGISGMGEELGLKYEQYRDDEYFTPDKFVEKPVDKQHLLSVIEQAIQKAQARSKPPAWRFV
ncbi:MAG: response regulator [Desulfosalsimonadaceae bacterium]